MSPSEAPAPRAIAVTGAQRRTAATEAVSASTRPAGNSAAGDVDRDALFAFRGGGGVGIATSPEFDPAPVPDRYAGELLRPVGHLQAVVGAWATTVGEVGDDVATGIAALHAPPGPPFPPLLHDATIIDLAVAESPDSPVLVLRSVSAAR